MIIHSTVITQRATVKLTRQEIRPTDHPSFRSPLLHRLASPRPSIPAPIFLLDSPPSPSLENLEAANLPPVICKPPPPSPRASHKLTELYYADPLVPLCPPISLPPPPPPSSYKSTIFPLAYKPLQLAGIFVSLFSPPSSRTFPSFFFFFSKSWKREDSKGETGFVIRGFILRERASFRIENCLSRES